MGMGTYSEVLITVPFNLPLSQSGVSTPSSDLSGRIEQGITISTEYPALPFWCLGKVL